MTPETKLSTVTTNLIAYIQQVLGVDRVVRYDGTLEEALEEGVISPSGPKAAMLLAMGDEEPGTLTASGDAASAFIPVELTVVVDRAQDSSAANYPESIKRLDDFQHDAEVHLTKSDGTLYKLGIDNMTYQGSQAADAGGDRAARVFLFTLYRLRA